MSKTSVLVVEDEAIVAADVAGKLEQLGYEVVGTAAGGEEAVESACRLMPGVVLMDIRLKGAMDGIEAAEAIRLRIDVPVIYLTAYSDSATLARAKLTDPFGYILKPFEERELATNIEMALYKHQADRELGEQREWLRVTLNSIGDAVIATDTAGRIIFINPVAESLTGWKAEEASGRPLTSVFRVVNEKTGQDLEEPVARVLREGRALPLANHAALVSRDGRTIPVEDSAAPILDTKGRVIGVVLVFHDVTEKRRAEEERETTVEFLRLVNENTTARGLIKAAASFFQRQSGCEAVGVRLREGDDYPYFEARGFPEEFVLLENQLCARDSNGVIVRDGAGNPVIECMCGNIIRGRFDPSKPFFSAGGSFWTNSTTELLASTTEVDRQSPTRNRCNGEGYESVALLPLQSGEGRIGLLQLNDRRKGLFTPETISAWERLAGYLAVAIAKTNAEEVLRGQTTELQELTRTLEERVKERTAELADLSSQLVSAQENERRRVSYDLHDNVWQMLLTIRFEIERLFSGQEDWGALRNKSKQVKKDIVDLVGKIRSMQGDLWPYVLDDIGLAATIDWYCREFEKNHSGLVIEMKNDFTDGEIPSSAKIVIYRILQETLDNIAKHSQASRVTLHLMQRDHGMEFNVKDNGIGFDLEETIGKRAPFGGLGLLSIKARTELSGGSFGIESAKGKGTTIRASWPI